MVLHTFITSDPEATPCYVVLFALGEQVVFPVSIMEKQDSLIVPQVIEHVNSMYQINISCFNSWTVLINN